MSRSEILHDVSEMLVNLLREKLDEVGLISVAVTAGSPLAAVDGPDAQAEARLNLFLYLVRPDEQRSYPSGVRVPLPDRRSGRGVVAAAPPLSLKLYYLITASGPDQLVQQRLLGLAMRVFHDNRTLAPPDNDQDPASLLRPERMQLVLLNLDIAEINAIWNTTSAVRETSAAYELSGVFLESGPARLESSQAAEPGQGHRRSESLRLVSGETIATPIETHQDWTRLVLPLRNLVHLDAIVHHQRISGHVEPQRKVHPGILALLHGPPGTGKTLGAQLIAGRLGLPLYRIDSGSINDTGEKGLIALLRVAQKSRAVLFFDEADALLEKRTVACDDHAIVQASRFLRFIESYEGIVLLATNFRRNIDDAFIRRMDHIVEFPAPDELERERLWQSLQPEEGQVLLTETQRTFLACQKLTGGHIMNVIQAAHQLAQTLSQEPTFLHLVVGLRRELEHLGRAMPGSALGEHAHGLACIDQLQRWLALLDDEVPLPVLSELSQLVVLEDALFLPVVLEYRALLSQDGATDPRQALIAALVKTWQARDMIAPLSEAERISLREAEQPLLEPGMSPEDLRAWLLHHAQ